MNIEEKADRVLHLLEEEVVFSLDTETTGLDPRTDVVCGIAFGFENESHYIPILHRGGGNHPAPHAFIDGVNARVDGRAHVAMHNASFDLQMLAKHKLDIPDQCVWDTMNTEALIDEHSRGFSLNAVAKKYGLGAKDETELYELLAWEFGGQPTRDIMRHFHRLPGTHGLVHKYAEQDATLTYWIYLKQYQNIVDGDLRDICRLENSLIPVLARMENRGMSVSQDALVDACTTLDRHLEQARMEFSPAFNPKSAAHVEAELVAQGFKDFPRTEKGNPSFSEAYLKTNEPGRKILEIRKWLTIKSMFIAPLLKVGVSGRIHPSWHSNRGDTHGTISGRLSCSKPNLQQIPKRREDTAKLVRGVFVPTVGRVFMEADWSQCEPRLFAHYTGESELVKGYNADPPRDVHTIVAEMLGVSRQFGKTLNMGIFNGMTAKTLSNYLQVPLIEGREYLDRWNNLFPAIAEFREKARVVYKRRGYVRTIGGRKCRLDDSKFAHKAVSRIIQGSNADIMKWALVRIDRVQGARLVATTHDSVLVELHKYSREQAAGEIEEIMTDGVREKFELRVPFVIDKMFGDTWAEASFS